MRKIGIVKLDEQGGIICPYCGGGYTHHKNVEVYHRKEDAEDTLRVSIEPIMEHNDTYEAKDAKVEIRHVDSYVCRNPSSRRGGILITVSCEHCPNDFYVGISQHKGVTLMGYFVER